MAQSHGAAVWREPAGSGATPSVAALRIIELSPGVYALSTTGAPGAAIVDLGSGVFAIDTTVTTGDKRLVQSGSKAVVY